MIVFYIAAAWVLIGYCTLKYFKMMEKCCWDPDGCRSSLFCFKSSKNLEGGQIETMQIDQEIFNQ